MEVISLYEMEVSPIEILHFMKNNIYNHEEQTIGIIDKTYTYQRKYLINLIHKISNKMGFKSQTFFLAVNYLDIIFIKSKEILYNYSLLAVACLIIASKFCENVPLRPIFKYFVNLYNNEIKDENNIITKDDLFKYEIIICKILNYKLNFYTIYDFNFFFFGNGIIKIEQLKEINYDISSINIENYNTSSNINSSSKIKKILIKIYEKSRHYLDIIIETLLCLKYNSLLISIYIMEKSIDYVLLKEFNLKNGEKSDSEKIQFNNREYFKQIMKDFYKINFESLPEYKNLKIECEKYKLFDDTYNKDSNNLNENINIINLNQINNCDQNSSSKNISKINNISPKDRLPNNNETNEKIKFLYKKVNVPVFPQNDMKKYHKNYMKHSSKKRINSSRDNKLYYIENKNKVNNSKILTTIDNFYQKDHINIRNSTSNNKNNYYLKKSNTSSSPFNKSPKNNLKNICNKLNMLSKIKIKKKLDGSDENIITNLNTVERKKKINKKIVKPYIKKIIQNYDKNQEENITRIKDNKNININININNKILYDNSNNYKDKTLTTKKILISKYLNKNNFPFIRGKSLVHKPRTKNKNNINSKIIFEASPIFERKSSNSKKRCNIPKYQCLIINKNNINSICLEGIDNNKNDNIVDNNIINSNRNYNAYKIKTKYDLYNSNLTSRNSFQYKNHNSKLTDSFLNIKIPHLNNDSFDKKMSTSIVEYNNSDNNNKLNPINNNNTLNEFKYKNMSLSQRNNNTNEFNNNNNQSSYKNQNQKNKNGQAKVNNSNNNNDNENEKKLTENSYKKNDIKAKNYSNVLDYSTGVSNEKNI